MPLSTYAELQAAVGAWNFDRTDLPTADLVALAEAELKAELRLRVMEVEAALAATPASRFVDLPGDFVAPVALWLELDSGRRALAFVSAGQLDTQAAAGMPELWTIDGEKIAFERPADQARSLTFRYLQGFSLSDDQPSNWLLANHPDLYLAACNVQAARWLQDGEQEARWTGAYQQALARVDAKEARSRAPAALRMEPLLSAGRRPVFDITRG